MAAPPPSAPPAPSAASAIAPSHAKAGLGGGGGDEAIPIAEAIVPSADQEQQRRLEENQRRLSANEAALRERLNRQEQRIAAQDRIIRHQAQLGLSRVAGRYVQTEDMELRMAFLRQKACKLACGWRIVPTVLLGWAAMWIFIWCYLWNWGTNILEWFVLQFLHIFSGFNSPFVEYAQHVIMLRAGQQNCCFWKSSYKLEGDDDDHLYYTV